MRLLSTLLILLLATPLAAQPLTALVLQYQEWEPGGQPYAARVMVTPRFMRQDFGPGDPDFLLFDRHAGVIYSVQTEDRRIL